MSEDWQSDESFAHTNLRMLEDGHLCDITLLAGEERTEVRCHRFILASRSPVFHAMFCGSLPEKDVVEIPDIEPDVLRKAVRFLYGWSVDLDPETVLFVDYAAQKYTIKHLEAKCKSFLENHMSADNVCTILEHAAKFDRKELVETCMKIVNDNATSVFESDSFLSVSHQVLELIVEKSSITRPLDIYKACKKWAKGQFEKQEDDVSCAQIRDLLGAITSKIKFSQMSCEDFLDNIAQDQVLNSEEVVKILLDIREKQKEERKQDISKAKDIQFQRSGTVEQGWSHDGAQDGIGFRVSTNVWLTAVDLFLPVKTGDKLTGTFEVFEDQTQVLTTNVTLFEKAGKQFECVQLPARVRLQTGKLYSLHQRLKGGNSYFANNCSTHIFVNTVNVTFSDLAVGTSDNFTCISSGQFHGLTLIKD